MCNNEDFSFVAFVDEAGDEGFKFPTALGDPGSSEWLIMSAAVFKAQNCATEVKCAETARAALKKPLHKPLHFKHLDHEQKVVYSHIVSKADFRSVNVAFYKPELCQRRQFQKKWCLYNYAGRFLLERISLLCANRLLDSTRPLTGDGRVKIIFSKRHEEWLHVFHAYVDKLHHERTPIDWDIVDAALIEHRPHGDLSGLQVADVLASGLLAALQPHQHLGIRESRYCEILASRYFEYDGRVLGYGFKPFPSTPDEVRALLPRHLLAALRMVGDEDQ